VDPSLAAYVVLTAALVVTPGASTAMVVRHVLLGGRRAGVSAAGGIAVANSTWAAAAGLGITAAVTRAPIVLAAIRFGGAAYLAFLGLRALARAWASRPSAFLSDQAGVTQTERRSAFRDGAAVNLLNPPIATFYLVVVPSFMPVPSGRRFLLLASIHIVMAFVCHVAWASGFDALRGIWTRPAARRSLDAAVGLALLALAVRMLR
jgi:threonine/homoserine/homoserine lactone efflux protein